MDLPPPIHKVRGGSSPSVLVTGGAGYIGAHVCKALFEAGYRPVAYDDLSAGNELAAKWGPLVVGDINDPSALRAAFELHQPIAVMHLAAVCSVTESVANPQKYERINVLGTRNVLQAMADVGIDTIIYSSSAAVYGDSPGNSLDETATLAPANPYGQSKLEGEQLLAAFETSDKLRWVALRYFNVAGGDTDCLHGGGYRPENNLIPLVLDVVKGKNKDLPVFGDDYATRDGTCVRDFVHVSDIASAHLAALRHLEFGARGKIFNLGSEQGYSVREVINSVEEVTGLAVPWRVEKRRPGDLPNVVANAALARELLGWKPRYESLEAIVASAWDWHRAKTGKA